MKKLFSVNLFGLATWSIIIFICIINKNCSGQAYNFTYKPVPAKYLPSSADLAVYLSQANNAKIGAYDLTNSLPPNFVRDGSVDYTNYLQLGINNNKKIIFPNFPVLINVKGLALISNSTLIFQPGSKLIMVPNGAVSYEILRLTKLQNVKIYFPKIEGDRNKHTGKTGEYGMGISITGSSNIKIINPQINNCWGDGIYIGKMIQPSKNIIIYYPILDNNRRNGISITSVDSLSIIHAVISNTNGTPPMAAVDFEPNSNTDIINNIYLDKPITFNSYYGIVLALSQLPGTIEQQVNISINNHIDENSYFGFGYAGFRDNYKGNVLNGNIRVINPVWKNNIKTLGYIKFLGGGTYRLGPNIEFKNVSIIKNNGTKNPDNDSIDIIKENFIKLNQINKNKVIVH